MTKDRPWRVTQIQDGTVHVTPEFEMHEFTEFCPCLPTVIDDDNGVIVKHNAYDHREIVEQARKILGFEDDDEDQALEE